jgi:hypothetical protein
MKTVSDRSIKSDRPSQEVYSDGHRIRSLNHAKRPPMMWPAEEQRQAFRAPYACPVSFLAMGQVGHGEILNLGNGGGRIRTSLDFLERGTIIRAQIQISNPPISVPVFGLVRWVKKESKAMYEIGLQFLS